MRAADLLSIDVAAELRRLASAAIEGPWQVPAELVRRAVASGARRVAVTLRRGELFVEDDGAAPSSAAERALCCLLDESRPPQERHGALMALQDEPELRALSALRPRRVHIERNGHSGWRLRVTTRGLDPDAARRWLAASARFAPIEVLLDGTLLPHGFGPTVAEQPLTPPLRGRLAVRPGMEQAHLWLQCFGVVCSHLTLPDTPAFEAAVELSPLTRSRTPAALREAVMPHLGVLVAQAVTLTLETAARRDLDEAVRHDLRGQLLVAARKGIGTSEILRAPLFRAVQGPRGGEEIRLALHDLGGAPVIPCLEPGEEPDDFLLPPGPVLVVDAEERGRVAQLLGVRFRPVEPRRVRLGWGPWIRRSVSDLGRAWREAMARALHPGRGAVLAPAALTAVERTLLARLRGALAEGEDVVMAQGTGPAYRVDRQWRLPRGNRDVATAARAVAQDARWARAAGLALLQREPPAPTSGAASRTRPAS